MSVISEWVTIADGATKQPVKCPKRYKHCRHRPYLLFLLDTRLFSPLCDNHAVRKGRNKHSQTWTAIEEMATNFNWNNAMPTGPCLKLVFCWCLVLLLGGWIIPIDCYTYSQDTQNKLCRAQCDALCSDRKVFICALFHCGKC